MLAIPYIAAFFFFSVDNVIKLLVFSLQDSIFYGVESRVASSS